MQLNQYIEKMARPWSGAKMRQALFYPKAIVRFRAMHGRNSSIRARLVMLVSRSSRDDKSGVCFTLKPATGQ
jgi:hypothetical protein